MSLSDNLRSRIFTSPSVVGNNAASNVSWLHAASYILPDLIAIADSATSGTGDIKSDGSVNFVANETWDAGGGDTTVIGVLGVTTGDGVDSNQLTKDELRIYDATDILSATKTLLAITDGIVSTGLSKSGLQAADGAVGTPSISFLTTTDMGFYLVSGVQLGVAVSGALVGGFDASGLFTGTISEQVGGVGVTIDGVLCKDSNVKTGAGLVTETAVGPAGDPNTGIYFPAVDEMIIAIGGSPSISFTAGSIQVSAPITTFFEINLNNDPVGQNPGSFVFDSAGDQYELICATGQINLLTNGGWTLPTGTPLKTGFNADASTTASAGYVQAESQAINDQLVRIAQTVKAIQDHLMTNMGLFTA